MIEKYDKFIPLYESIGKIVTLAVEKGVVGIRIEDILKQADSLGIEIYESEIKLLLDGLITYFLNLGIIAEESESFSGEIIISFKKASEEEMKYGNYLDAYKTLGTMIQNYRENLPYIIPESKFSGEYKILEETFEEILASKRPFAIYTADLLKYVDTLLPKQLRESTKPELFLEGLQWYLEDREGIYMNISPLISIEKGDLISDILVFEKSE